MAAVAPDEQDSFKRHRAKELLDPSTIARHIMFGHGCEVDTAMDAQRYAYAA